MKKSSAAALALVAVLGLGAVAQAQMGHGSHGGHGMGQGQPQTMADMDRMMGMMRQMMPMMERMRNATPAERERLMNEMRPMMQGMMPMMHGMMGGHGMGMGAMTGPGHQGHGQTSAAAPPSTRAFEEANAKMHRESRSGVWRGRVGEEARRRGHHGTDEGDSRDTRVAFKKRPLMAVRSGENRHLLA